MRSPDPTQNGHHTALELAYSTDVWSIMRYFLRLARDNFEPNFGREPSKIEGGVNSGRCSLRILPMEPFCRHARRVAICTRGPFFARSGARRSPRR